MPGREGAFWVFVALAVPRLFGAIFTIGLRRFLGPGVSGTFDLAAIPYRFLDNFRNFGTGPALVYERTVDRAVANTAWTLNMMAAIVVTVVAQLLAHPVAVYYGHPSIEGIFRALSIGYVFASITSTHYFLLLRDMDFRMRSVPAMGQVVAAGVVAILFALWGFGVGALVAREVISAVAGAVLLWAVYPFRPRPQLVPGLASRLLGYGVWVGMGLTILYISQNADTFIGGRIIHNTRDIGFYTTSWSLAFLTASVLTVTASSMVFPALSRLQHDPSELAEKLVAAFRQLGLIMFPAAALLAVLAPVVIVPLLGDKWAHYRDSFPVLSLLALYAGNRAMLFIFFEGYKSIGKPWIIPSYNAVKLVIMVPAMIYGAQHGILGLAMTYVPVQLLEIPAALFLARRVLRVSPVALLGAAALSLLAALGMAAAAAGTEALMLHVVRAGDLFTLCVSLLVAVCTYCGIVFAFDRSILHEARRTLVTGL